MSAPTYRVRKALAASTSANARHGRIQVWVVVDKYGRVDHVNHRSLAAAKAAAAERNGQA